MARGIHRFVITFAPTVVKVRAQSASLRGQAFTVGGAKVSTPDGSRASKKTAAAAAIKSLYPKQV